MRKLILGFVFMLLFSMTVHAETISQPDNAEEASGTDNSSMETDDSRDTKREFKDLIIYEPYEHLNSEITGDYDEAHAVKCVNGTFVGTEENGVASWLGIPYAKPPVGERRFKAPEYVDASDRVFEAKYYGKSAYTTASYSDVIQKLASEDVMVWIHGGAYSVGSGSQFSYNGANLVQAQSDIILVNMNYRLNMYGFMDFSSVPGGEAFESASCNGLLDQAMALRWVHENIAAFGGDPDNVTVFGQSAGGGSVSILSVMKEANQYFQKIIAQSGSTCLSMPVGCETAKSRTNALLEYTGCKTMDDIMALSEEELHEAYVNAVSKFTTCPYSPRHPSSCTRKATQRTYPSWQAARPMRPGCSWARVRN